MPRPRPRHAARLDRNAVIAVIAAALIWGLYNVGFATIFSFGPSMLVEHGWSITAAGSAISIVLWLTVVSVPSGGFLADRIGRPGLIIVAGCIVFAMLMMLLPRSGAVDCRHRCTRAGLRPAGRFDHEPARARAAACHARDRHGPVLHRLLRRA